MIQWNVQVSADISLRILKLVIYVDTIVRVWGVCVCVGGAIFMHSDLMSLVSYKIVFGCKKTRGSQVAGRQLRRREPGRRSCGKATLEKRWPPECQECNSGGGNPASGVAGMQLWKNDDFWLISEVKCLANTCVDTHAVHAYILMWYAYCVPPFA